MKRRLATLAAAGSLVLCVATVLLAIVCISSLYMSFRGTRSIDCLEWWANGKWWRVVSENGTLLVFDETLRYGDLARLKDSDLLQRFKCRVVSGMELRQLDADPDYVASMSGGGIAVYQAGNGPPRVAASPFGLYVITPRPVNSLLPLELRHRPRLRTVAVAGNAGAFGVVRWEDSPFKRIGVEWRFSAATPGRGTFWLRARWHTLAILAAILPTLRARRMFRSCWRRYRGRCHRCGYDLRATPDRCPECGGVPAAPPAR